MIKRIFSAIDISDRARIRISDYIETLRRDHKDLRVGWEKPEKLHFTLKFFGEVNKKELNELTSAVDMTARAIAEMDFQNMVFDLQIMSTGVFPDLRNPRVLWLGLNDRDNLLKTIIEVLEIECQKRGFKREKRAFKPHLTIARLREPNKAKDLAKTHIDNVFEPVEFSASSIAIYESTLLPTGSVYQKIADFSFSPS